MLPNRGWKFYLIKHHSKKEKMKKIEVFKKENPNEVIAVCNDLSEASETIINECQDDDNLTVFDFDTREVEEKEPAEICPDFASSCKYLGISDEFAFDCADEHVKAMQSFYMLVIIAQAWNKIDNFVPDYSNRDQWKYFPWFIYDKGHAGFVCAYTDVTATDTSADFGSRLCFKSSNRARQFGKQFIDLWNDLFLFR
jgi:hypothetical protein